MDASNACEIYAAGNAVVPQVATWVAEKVIQSMTLYG
jgi:site-specific DNA-cytosine methylase